MEVATNETFVALTANKRVLVDFYADWCGPCQRMMPALESINEDLIPVVKVNVDESSDLANEMSVRSIPTLVVFSNGEEVDRIVGSFPERVLRSKIEAIEQAVA